MYSKKSVEIKWIASRALLGILDTVIKIMLICYNKYIVDIVLLPWVILTLAG